MALFGNGQDTQARKELADLRGELHALQREVADLHADVLRWQKRDRTRAARTEEQPEESPVAAATPEHGGVAGLTPARLRIMRRRLAARAPLNGEGGG